MWKKKKFKVRKKERHFLVSKSKKKENIYLFFFVFLSRQHDVLRPWTLSAGLASKKEKTQESSFSSSIPVIVVLCLLRSVNLFSTCAQGFSFLPEKRKSHLPSLLLSFSSSPLFEDTNPVSGTVFLHCALYWELERFSISSGHVSTDYFTIK